MDVVWFGLLVVSVAVLGTLAGGGRSRTTHTDATGMLLCRSCGASAPERAGGCPRCGALL